MRKVCVKEFALFNNSKLNFAATELMFCRAAVAGGVCQKHQPLLGTLIIKTREIHTPCVCVEHKRARALRNIKPGIFALCSTQRPIFVCDGVGAGVSERERERAGETRNRVCASGKALAEWSRAESQRHSSSRQMNGYLIVSACVSCAYRISRCARERWIICCSSPASN